MKLWLSFLLALPLLPRPVVPVAMAADVELVLQGGESLFVADGRFD
jgi:hypothetical protein